MFDLDPAVGSNASAVVTQQSTFWCTKGTSFTITATDGLHFSGGSRRMAGPGPADFIPYTLGFTASGTGGGRGTTLSAGISAEVNGSDYINATAGAYSDTVVLTINP